MSEGRKAVRHHEVFERFPPWSGQVKAGYGANFLGVQTRGEIWPEFVKPVEKDTWIHTAHPGLDDDYLEWISVLSAVTEARETFTMLELGAGWARWTVNAALAARQLGGLACHLVAVEAEPTHFAWARSHVRDNKVRDVRLVRAAVAADEGEVWFYVGLPGEWYGQAIAPPRDEPAPRPGVGGLRDRLRGRPVVARAPELDEFLRSMTGDPERLAYVRKVKTIGLAELLAPFGHVDLIHFDVQGAELDVLRGAAVEVDNKVRRVHIGTHSSEVEQGIEELFGELAWETVFDYGLTATHETPWGEISLIDGVYAYSNPRLLP